MLPLSLSSGGVRRNVLTPIVDTYSKLVKKMGFYTSYCTSEDTVIAVHLHTFIQQDPCTCKQQLQEKDDGVCFPSHSVPITHTGTDGKEKKITYYFAKISE